MRSKQQLFFFIVATTFCFLVPLPLVFYSPYLAHILITRPLKTTLWHAIFCGLIVDLTQSTLPFGCVAFGYAVVILLLYKNKWFFFSDRFFSLPLFTTLFSFLFSIIQTVFLRIAKQPLKISYLSAFSDYLLMPLLDGVYSFICFILPLMAFTYFKRYGFSFLFIRRTE